MRDFKDLSRDELKSLLKSLGLSAYTADQLFSWVYKRRIEDFSRMSDLSKAARQALPKALSFFSPGIKQQQVSCDGTLKFLLELRDANCVEAVVIPKEKRRALCLSTQVGCKFNCSFCQSGKGGFIRDLSCSEIVGEFLAAQDSIKPEKVSHVIFMGIGEPLDNLASVAKAINIISDNHGIGLGPRRITISTCGLPDKIRELADMDLGIQLCVSLHATNDTMRSKLMPVNKIYPLSQVLAAAKYFAKKDKEPVTFEYVLIDGFNASLADAHALVRLLAQVSAKVNLIPINPVKNFPATWPSNFNGASSSAASGLAAARIFQKELEKKGLFATIRHSRGADISAACGQLRARAK